MINKNINIVITSMTQMTFIKLDSQNATSIEQIYSSLFNQEETKEKKKGLRIFEQRPAQKPSDLLQEKLIKILEHLQSYTFSKGNKQRRTQERVCNILKHFIDRNQQMAKGQIQYLQGEIKTKMRVFINCYFYQSIPLDNLYNQPLGRYFDAVTKSQATIAVIQEEFKKLPDAQSNFFYLLNCQICTLKQQFINFQKFKQSQSQKERMVLAQVESMMDETNQKNMAIQERDELQLKMDKVNNILTELAFLQERKSHQKTYGTLDRDISESPQEFRQSFRKIYSQFMDLSKKSTERHEQSSSKTLLNEMKIQNNSLKRTKDYLEQENQKLQIQIMELERNINSHQINDKSKKEQQMRLKIIELEDSNKALKKQAKLYEDKVKQNKELTLKINKLNDAIIDNKEIYKTDHEQVEQNLQLAKFSLTVLAAEKDQQKLDYAKLQQRNTQLKQEMDQLRNQILSLKQQTVNLALQPSQSVSSTDEIITKLRTNEKIQKKNHDKLADLFEKEKAQRREANLQASRLRESNEASQNIISKLKEDIQRYQRMMQQSQGNMKMRDTDGENAQEDDHVYR